MSKENLEQFMSKVADSEELQSKIGEEIDGKENKRESWSIQKR